MYLGDFKEDGDIFFKFTTRAFATGIPGTLGDTPVLSVYVDEATATEKTTAEAYFDLDEDFDSVTGLNNVRIDLSGDAFFATGADYTVVITTGTVGGVSVVGEVVATFSIENRSMGQPAGATLAADIAAIKSETATIEGQTDDIGVAGAGLTDLGGMSTGMKTEVESEANDALVALKLDHLVAIADSDDVVNNSVIAKMVSSAGTADWSGFVNTTDSLQAIRDRGDAEWATATGFSTHDAAAVWSVATRVLTANTNLNDVSTAQVNTEVDNAIVTYGLDHLVQTSVTGTDVANNSIIAKLVDDAATADWDGYDPTTASLEALNVDTDAIVVGTITNAQGANVATDVAAMIDGNNRVDVGSWLGNAVTHGTGGPDVNINAVSDDTTAAANLELFTEVLENGTGLIDAGTFKAGAIDASAIATDAITATKIAANAITSSEIADGAITAAKITALDSTAWGNAQNFFDTTGWIGGTIKLTVDATKISGDSTAADNLELQYDTTGLTGDTFPATQTQVSNIAIAGSAVNQPAKDEPNGFVIQSGKGENEANNEDSTKALDGTTHDIEAANVASTEQIDVYYEFNISSGIPSSVTVHGYLNKGGGAAKNITVQAQNVDATTWRTVGSITSGTSIETDTFDLFIGEVGTGANLGIVRIRFLTGSVPFSATTKLLVDQIFVSFSQGVEGYDNGAIWIDTTLSNTNTVVGVDGTARNPVSTIAAANTLSVATNLNRFMVAPGSTITFAATQDNQLFIGHDWTLALGSRSVANSYIEGAIVSGTFTGTPTFADCDVGTITGPSCNAQDCLFDGTITADAAGNWTFHHCASGIAGATTPIFDFGTDAGVNSNLTMADWSNGIELRNYNNAGTDRFSISGQGQVIYAASCSGTVNQRGDWKVTNTGGVTITEDDNTSNIAAVLVDTTGLNGDAMRGTDSAALASVCTEARLAELDAGNLPTDVAANATPAEVNAEVSDVLKTDVITLPSQTAPPSTPTFEQALSWLYKVFRNRKTQTATQWSLLADDESTVDAKATISDDGATTTKQEVTSGP